MNPIELKVARIGNSRGVRIPAGTLARYRIGAAVVMEERSDGILLRPLGSTTPRLSWEDTARDMAVEREGWRAWDAAIADGLDDVPWQPDGPRRVAENTAKYARRVRPKKTKK